MVYSILKRTVIIFLRIEKPTSSILAFNTCVVYTKHQHLRGSTLSGARFNFKHFDVL